MAPRRSTCSSRGSAIPGASTSARVTTSAGSSLDELARRHGGSWRSQVLGLAGRGAPRRPEARAAQAGDVHERLGPSRWERPRGSTRSSRSDLLVVHDDVDLEPGRLQARRGRRARRAQRPALAGPARSGSQEFQRLRIGVGRPGRGDRRSVSDCVLSRLRSPRTTSKRSSRGRRTRSRRSPPKGSRRRSAASTERPGVRFEAAEPRGSVFRHGPHDHDPARAAPARASSCLRTSGSSPTRRRCRPLRGSPSRPCRSCSPRSTSSSDRPLVCLLPGGRGRPRRGRGRALVPRRRAGRAAPEPRRALGLGARAAAAPRRRAGPGARRARRGRARLRLGGGGRRGAAAAPTARPEPLALAVGRRSRSRRARGAPRARRATSGSTASEERGHFAVRGGLVDVFPTTGREPLRIELFGDEIEAIRAFSPFTQRALHPVDERADLPGRRAPARPASSRR